MAPYDESFLIRTKEGEENPKFKAFLDAVIEEHQIEKEIQNALDNKGDKSNTDVKIVFELTLKLAEVANRKKEALDIWGQELAQILSSTSQS